MPQQRITHQYAIKIRFSLTLSALTLTKSPRRDTVYGIRQTRNHRSSTPCSSRKRGVALYSSDSSCSRIDGPEGSSPKCSSSRSSCNDVSHVLQAATLCSRGRSPMQPRPQPLSRTHVAEAAALRAPGTRVACRAYGCTPSRCRCPCRSGPRAADPRAVAPSR